MQIFQYILLAFLVICAVSVSFSKRLLNSILIFMSYSLIMSIIWILLESPDLAITEAAVVKLGTELLPDDIILHNERGFEVSNHTNIQTIGNEVVLDFRIKEPFSDLQLDLSYETYNGPQTVKLYANDELVADYEADGREEKSIIIPGEYVTDGTLRLHFYLPNAVSPVEIDPDIRNIKKLSLMFYRIKLSDTATE